MINLPKWIRGALLVAAAAGVLFLLTRLFAEPHPVTPAMASADSAATPVASAPGTGAATASSASEPLPDAAAQVQAWFAPLPQEGSPLPVSPLSTMTPPRFSADSRGKLVLNGDTHSNLEKLLLEEDPQALRAKLAQASAGLPPQAAAELRVLVSQFQQYAKALSHSISPEHVPQNEQEGVALINNLHTLRVSYLGAEATQAMFGEEETMTRQLIALMASDKDPSLTPQQKAERAQEILSRKRPPAPAG